MRVLFSMCCLVSGCLYAGTAFSSYQSLSNSPSLGQTPLQIANTTPKSQDSNLSSSLNIQIKSAQSNFGRPVKLAAVNFIAKLEAGVLPNPPATSTETCTGYPYQYERALTNCATSARCGSGNSMRFKCTSCKDNMTLGTDGRCKCDRSVYKYSLYGSIAGAETCPYGYDDTSVCKEVGSDGALYTFYAGCLCPDSWIECNGAHQVGIGSGCTVGNVTKYYTCGCAEPYTSSCSNSTPANPTDYCINLNRGGERYYNGCSYCEVSATSNYSQEAWWDSICPEVFSCGEYVELPTRPLDFISDFD